MRRWLYGDVETTGTDDTDRIVELAWIEFDEQLNEIDRFHTLVDPERLISPSAMGVHHITDEMVEDAPTLAEVFDIVKPNAFTEDDEVVLCAHNAQFDYRFLKEVIPIVDQLCTLRLARYFWPDVQDHKLQTLRYTFKLQGGEGAHGALEDCETGIALLRFMCQERGVTLQQLLDYTRNPLPMKKIPFGKHRGSNITDLPRGYRVWLLGQDIDEDLRYAVKATF